MTRPHDEAWAWKTDSTRGHAGCVIFPKGSVLVKYDPANYTHEEGVARGHLAAAAPDMARVLLDIEWAGHCMSYGRHCPSCLVYPDEDGCGEVHKPDCKLDAALRKGGVR